jgi:hypothetical protein
LYVQKNDEFLKPFVKSLPKNIKKKFYWNKIKKKFSEEIQL